MVTVFSPALFMATTPPQPAYATANACNVGEYISKLLGGIANSLGFGGDVATTEGVGAAVPVKETNATVLDSVSQTAAQTTSLTFKECVLDPIMWVAKKIVITSITQAIVRWISNGFDGAPTFLTDPTQFFSDIAKQTVSSFLFESGLDQLLCQPFVADLQYNLNLEFARPKYGDPNLSRLSCSLDEVFSQGIDVNTGFDIFAKQGHFNFKQGGFPAFFSMINDQNNAIGSYYQVQSEAAQRTYRIQAKEGQLLAYGNGYFSLRCDPDGDGKDSVCTPGQYVSQQIDNNTNSALSQLEVADEVAEVLDALMTYLVQNVLTKADENGLLGQGNWTADQSTSGDWRDTLPPEVRGQIDQGASDIGGVAPTTPDQTNPGTPSGDSGLGVPPPPPPPPPIINDTTGISPNVTPPDDAMGISPNVTPPDDVMGISPGGGTTSGPGVPPPPPPPPQP